MYDLRASMLKGVLPKSTTWRTALILSQAGAQYSEYSRNKPKGADPRNDFPGFDLEGITQAIKVYLGKNARGVRINEVLGHLWHLTTKKSFPEGHSIVAYRPDASTKERPVFSLGKLGDDLHRALENGGHYPYLLSIHSKSYWSSILILGALQAGHALTEDQLVTWTGMTSKQITAALDLLVKGFTATSSAGETREYQGGIVEKKGKFRLPLDLMFGDGDEVGDIDIDLPTPPDPIAEMAQATMAETPPDDSPSGVSPQRGLFNAEDLADGVLFPILGEDARLIKAEAAARNIKPVELAADLLAPRFAEIRPMLRDMAKHREDVAKNKQAAFEAEKARLESEFNLRQARLESEFALRQADLAAKMGVTPA